MDDIEKGEIEVIPKKGGICNDRIKQEWEE